MLRANFAENVGDLDAMRGGHRARAAASSARIGERWGLASTLRSLAAAAHARRRPRRRRAAYAEALDLMAAAELRATTRLPARPARRPRTCGAATSTAARDDVMRRAGDAPSERGGGDRVGVHRSRMLAASSAAAGNTAQAARELQRRGDAPRSRRCRRSIRRTATSAPIVLAGSARLAAATATWRRRRARARRLHGRGRTTGPADRSPPSAWPWPSIAPTPGGPAARPRCSGAAARLRGPTTRPRVEIAALTDRAARRARRRRVRRAPTQGPRQRRSTAIGRDRAPAPPPDES